jgi:hypothetical protein
MKKSLLIAVALLGLSIAAVAQPKAIGIRGGLFGRGFGGEISYEHWFTLFDNDYDFLEAELGVINNGFKATAMYNFTLAQPEITDRGEWGLYAGPGVTAGYGTAWSEKYNEDRTSPFLGLSAQVGMEYTFWFPLQLSVDFRPNFLFPVRFNQHWYGFALSARYSF